MHNNGMKKQSQADTDLIPQSITLAVRDLSLMKDFYIQHFGFHLHYEDTDRISLGNKHHHLLTLVKTEHAEQNGEAGLYHVAYLFKERHELAEILIHLAKNNIHFQGASDHLYSEALYLADPEGNGIELYCDRPVSQWTILDSGEIVGDTLPLDIEDLLAQAQSEFSGIFETTRIGHYHLSVIQVEETFDFYHQIMGLGLKYRFGSQAIFMASGQYHHHLGANNWLRKRIPNNETTPGLIELHWQASQTSINDIIHRLDKEKRSYTQDRQSLTFHDNSHIKTIIHLHEEQ